MKIKMFNAKKCAALDQMCMFYKEHLCTFLQLIFPQNNHIQFLVIPDCMRIRYLKWTGQLPYLRLMYKIVMLYDNK